MADTAADGEVGPIAASVGKVEAVRMLAARAGLTGADADGPAVADTIAAITKTLGRLSNKQVELRDAKALPVGDSRVVFAKGVRSLPPPLHRSGMPQCFTDASPVAHTPDFTLLTLHDGYFCHYRDGPLVVTPQGEMVVRDFSSRFAGLVHCYETDLPQMLADAYQIGGTAIVMADDVRPLNYCHWMVDWLPRLACLGELARRDDTVVLLPPLDAQYQWDTLALCGFPPSRVVQIDAMRAVRAHHLLVPNDLTVPPHPGHKAAPWLLDYLRSALGYGAFLAGLDGPPRREKLYVSRGDAGGRRVLNEPELVAALARFGYRLVTLAGLSAVRQISAFATASHIVAPHGAGLANIVFANPAATLIEIFPASYGTAAYYVLAAGLGITYASYISDTITQGSRAQLDDITVDVADFLARCGDLL